MYIPDEAIRDLHCFLHVYIPDDTVRCLHTFDAYQVILIRDLHFF